MSNFIEMGLDPAPPGGLTVELVPSTSWGNNLRSRLAKKDWDKLRRAQYATAGHVCEICGGKGRRHPVECHEIWRYDDVEHVQTLGGLIALCPPCHSVKHLGLAYVQGREKQAIRHMTKVNGWALGHAHQYVAEAFRTHERRSAHKWTLDLEWLRTVGVEIPTE